MFTAVLPSKSAVEPKVFEQCHHPRNRWRNRHGFRQCAQESWSAVQTYLPVIKLVGFNDTGNSPVTAGFCIDSRFDHRMSPAAVCYRCSSSASDLALPAPLSSSQILHAAHAYLLVRDLSTGQAYKTLRASITPRKLRSSFTHSHLLLLLRACQEYSQGQ